MVDSRPLVSEESFAASVIVPTFNRANSLDAALRSLTRQSFDDGCFEIIVVDNGSSDNTRPVVEGYVNKRSGVDVRYVFDPEPGLLTGRHRGAREARADILAFVDDDIEADPLWLSAVQKAFSGPTVHIVCGPSLPKYERTPPRWLEALWIECSEGRYCGELSLLDFGDIEREVDPLFAWGLNYCIRKETLFELGGFHPDCMPPGLQHIQGDGEAGLSFKARKAGYKALYAPAARVYHRVSASRLTVAYFERRWFYQGVCDSFNEIRRAYFEGESSEYESAAVLSRSRTLMRRLLGNVARTVAESPAQRKKRRFAKQYAAGYGFHQNAVAENPWLREWVLRADYWDYGIPRETLRGAQH